MSIADHFDHAPDAPLVRDYDSGTARRQFNISMVLIAVVAMVAFALSALVRFDAPQGVGLLQPVSPPAYAGKL